MSARVFLSQAAVERLEAAGGAELCDGALVARGGALDGRRFDLAPAVRVAAVSGGGADPHRLVAKVKRVAELRASGAELLDGSLLLGDAAYDVEPGFLASPMTPPEAAEQPAASTPPQGQSDAEALARFLLDHLP